MDLRQEIPARLELADLLGDAGTCMAHTGYSLLCDWSVTVTVTYGLSQLARDVFLVNILYPLFGVDIKAKLVTDLWILSILLDHIATSKT